MIRPFAAKMRVRAVMLTIMLVFIVALVCLRSMWLKQLGHALILPPDRSVMLSAADVVLVPNAGDSGAEMGRARLEAAALLVRQHRAGLILMSCAQFYGVSVCDMASNALKQWGYNDVVLRPLNIPHMPDSVDARFMLAACKQAGFRRAFVLLPNHTTRRLARVYGRLGHAMGIRVAVLTSPDRSFDPDSWWHSRESQKVFFSEVIGWTGLL